MFAYGNGECKTVSYLDEETESPKRRKPDYHSDERNDSVVYSSEKSHDGELVYCNGRLITVHEKELPVGLLGYTNTVSDIFLTTRKDFDVPREKVLTHEKLHCSLPDASEEEIRYKTDVEFRPAKELSAVSFSFYSKPIYTD